MTFSRYRDILFSERGEQYACYHSVLWPNGQNVLACKEHNPPHIHILYGEYNAVIDLQTLTLMEGDLPGKGLAMAMEWTTLHRDELLEMWSSQNFRHLPPLQ